MKENKKMVEKYIFIVDTTEYAGDFEREMCAFCTGVIGDCEVGREEKKKWIEAYGEDKADEMYEMMEQRPDEHGCRRPVSIVPTPGYINTGMGKHIKEKDAKPEDERYPAYQSVAMYFYERPTKEVINMIKERAKLFTKTNDRISREPRTLKILGFRLLKETTVIEEIAL